MHRIRHLAALRSALALVVLLASAGCQHLGDVVIKGPLEAPELQARTTGLWKRSLPCLNEVTITQGTATMWRITSLDGECAEARRLRYGTVPEGFIQEASAKPLQQDVAYGVSASGWTARVPNVPFQARGRVMFQGGRWTKP